MLCPPPPPRVHTLPNCVSFLPGRYALVLRVHSPTLRPPLDRVNHPPSVINAVFCVRVLCLFASHGLDAGCGLKQHGAGRSAAHKRRALGW